MISWGLSLTVVVQVCSSLLDGQSVDLEVVEEVAPGLGEPDTTFQQYVMPAFCTQVRPGKAGSCLIVQEN